MKQNIHTTPEGYFDNLRSRLCRIPVEEDQVTTWQKVRPHLAMAAAFIAIVTAGTAILRSSVQDSDSSLYETQYELAQLVRTATPYYFDEEDFQEELEDYTDEDVIDYLIYSGLTVEHMEADASEND